MHIYAEQSISDSKVLHAAAIAAELLDNNEDGIIDDENVKNALMDVYTVMPLFAYEGSNAEEILFENFVWQGIKSFQVGRVKRTTGSRIN